MNTLSLKVSTLCSIIVTSLLIAACASQQPAAIYQHATPINPTDNDPATISTVTTTHPTFRWSGLTTNDLNTNYSLGIWGSVVADTSLRGSVLHSSSNGPVLMRGELIFKKDQIQGNEFRPDVTLIPGRYYFWSVKPSNSSEWATVRYEMDDDYLVFGSSSSRINRMFLFRVSDLK